MYKLCYMQALLLQLHLCSCKAMRWMLLGILSLPLCSPAFLLFLSYFIGNSGDLHSCMVPGLALQGEDASCLVCSF